MTVNAEQQIREALGILRDYFILYDEEQRRTVGSSPAIDKAESALAALGRLVAERDEAQRELQEARAALREVREWFEELPKRRDPDPGSFGGHPYSPNERALGYGTYRDPRFLPRALGGGS